MISFLLRNQARRYSGWNAKNFTCRFGQDRSSESHSSRTLFSLPLGRVLHQQRRKSSTDWGEFEMLNSLFAKIWATPDLSLKTAILCQSTGLKSALWKKAKRFEWAIRLDFDWALLSLMLEDENVWGGHWALCLALITKIWGRLNILINVNNAIRIKIFLGR